MKESIVSIEIALPCGGNSKMTIEQARKLYEQLRILFRGKAPDEPVFAPATPHKEIIIVPSGPHMPAPSQPTPFTPYSPNIPLYPSIPWEPIITCHIGANHVETTASN